MSDTLRMLVAALFLLAILLAALLLYRAVPVIAPTGTVAPSAPVSVSVPTTQPTATLSPSPFVTLSVPTFRASLIVGVTSPPTTTEAQP